MRTAIATLLLVSLLAPLAQASDSHGASASAHAEGKKKKKKVEVSEAQALYEEFLELDKQAEKNKACLLDKKCIQPEDGLLKASQDAAKVLEAMQKRARNGDNESAFYVGLLMYDQARLFAAQAEALAADPALKSSHDLLVRRSQDVYLRSGRYLAQSARAGEPEACMRYGIILADGLSGQSDRKLAYKLFRCAALGYIAREQRGKATDAYLRMVPLSDPRDIATAEVYSKLKPQEPDLPWRKPARPAE